MTEQTIFSGLVSSWFILSAVVFVALFLIVAPYGRHNRGGWGPQINATVGWVVMEAPAPLFFALLFLLGKHTSSPVALVFLAMWLLHYVNRAFVFPFRRRGSGKQLPLTIFGMALLFNGINAYINGRYLFTFSPQYTTAWLLDPRFLIGVSLFFVGFAINQHADLVLFRLRKPGDSGYKIPRGGMYRYVSCPNYLGEIIEWTGWAVATWSIPGLAFAVWTAANLAPRAVSNHRWYRETFPDYPSKRRAFIPYII
jgi:3-oxo-5-alpha-steroid 4-dehydrogenase 1